MKTIPLLAAALLLVVTDSAGDIEPSTPITKDALKPREVSLTAIRSQVDGLVRVADAQSVNAFASFATSQAIGAAIDYAGMYAAMVVVMPARKPEAFPR